jgi:lysophospholipase L1-like esterase
LSLPAKYELVVGDTFELFYKGLLYANNPYLYNIKVSCSKGSAYSKRYIYTPVVGDIGTHSMVFSVFDDNDVLLDTKTVSLIVKNKAVSPATVKNILNVGDSLTAGGVWVSEAYRRLIGVGGTPAADALTNINFIGSVVGTGGAKFVGYGGWTYTNYNTNSLPPNYWVTATSGMKTNVASQQSVWVDSNSKQWQLETIDVPNSKLKFKQYPAGSNNVIPTSGTLTYVSGGGDTANIVYTTATIEAINPFWIGGKVDFGAYASSIGASSIDHVNVLLGWNSTGDSETKLKSDVRTFINNVRTSYPLCKITLLGLQVPSIDGFGTSYGASWNYMEKLKVVFNFNKWNAEVATEFANVDFINVAGQFDTENNMPTATRAVNVRNVKTEVYGTNGVHPSNEGYLQIADAVYRNLTHKL